MEQALPNSSTQDDHDRGYRSPSLVCVVVNWNGWQDTLKCLDSLRVQDYPNLSVIVVDNGSTNESVSKIREAHPWVTLHETGENLGFPSGCNVGTRLAYAQGARWIWLLNNDTVAPPDTASRLVETALASPKAGAIGAILYHLDEPAKVQAWGGGRINLQTAFVSHFTAPASFEPHNTFFTGASLMVPRSICEEVGIFFEGFFMYGDDADLCLRIHRAGYAFVVAPNTAILHKVGGSNSSRSPMIDQYATSSAIRLLQRNADRPTLSIAVYLLLRLSKRLLTGRWRNARAVLRGVSDCFRERERQFTDRL